MAVFADPRVVTDLIDDLQNHPSIRSLLTQNQNRVGQVITSLSQQLNQINDEQVDLAASSNSIAVTYLCSFSLVSPRWHCCDKYFHFTFGHSAIVVGGNGSHPHPLIQNICCVSMCV